MKKERLKPWLLLLLFLSVACMFVGAWANATQKVYAKNILGSGLIGILLFIIAWALLFGATNRPSNWFRGRKKPGVTGL